MRIPVMATNGKYVGRRVKRTEDPRLIQGLAHYVDDIKLADTLHVAFLRSPHAHARITSIDVAADPEAAARKGAPVIHEEFGDNIAYLHKAGLGDVEAAFAQADRVLKQRLGHQRLGPIWAGPPG